MGFPALNPCICLSELCVLNGDEPGTTVPPRRLSKEVLGVSAAGFIM
jgi:hypothetical protein